MTITQAQPEILCYQAASQQTFDAERNNLGIGTTASFAKNIGIKLIVGAQAPFLRFLVAKVFGDVKPLHRPFQRIGLAADHSRQRRRQFWPQGHCAATLVDKVEQLLHDFRAAFFGKKLQRFESRYIIGPKTRTAGHLGPDAK